MAKPSHVSYILFSQAQEENSSCDLSDSNTRDEAIRQYFNQPLKIL